MKYLLLIMLFLGAFLAETSSAQWKLTNGPYEAYARCLAAGKSALFAGTASGVYRSTDSGATWKSVNYYYPASMVLALAVQDSFIFAADTSGRIYRTSDNGSSWKLLKTRNPNIGLSVTDSLLFAFSWDGAIGRSTNHGDSLKLCTISSQSGVPQFYSIVRHDSILYAGTSQGIFTSRNEGWTWMPAQSSLGNSFTTSLVQNTRFMFTGVYEGYTGSLAGAFRSADGVHWDQINSGLLIDTFVQTLIATNDSTVFAGTYEGIYRTTNNGSSWKEVSGIGSILAFAASGNTIYAATYEHIVRSTDNGSTWEIIDSGMSLTHASGFARNNTDFYAVTDVGIFRYTQNNSWKPVFEKLGLRALAIHGSQILTGGSNGDVYYSIDAGKSWIKTNTSVNGNIRAMAIDGNNFYAATDNYSGLLHSTDYGVTWSIALKQNTTLPQTFATINSVIISANFLDYAFRSTDNGISWKNIDSSLGAVYTISCVDTQFWAGTRNGVFFSNDLGLDWTRMNGFTDTGITTLAIDDKNIFVGIYGYGMYKYDNGSWISINDGLIDSNIYYLTLDSSDLFYASHTGIWRRSLSDITSGVKNVFTGNGILLHANYPNPFSTQTTISFSTSKREYLDVKIFDLLGRECVHLFYGELDAGEHSYEWNAPSLPVGAYICRIRSADGLAVECPAIIKY